ncbi:MAG: DUF4365 domain-containing protein [Planctomycetes bacterium]|nr:DUF4365 domain-containing protein [Planctomycetota bacterium]
MKYADTEEVKDKSHRIFYMKKPIDLKETDQGAVPSVDFRVVLLENGNYSHFDAWVQIKGRSTIDCQGALAIIDIENKYLQDWTGNRRPVFLLAIDVTTEDAYFLFMQRHIKEEIPDVADRKPDSTTRIKIPTRNRLDDHVAIRAAIKEADAYMPTLHPASVTSLIKSTEAELQSLDPRFFVTLIGTSAGERIELHPKERVSFKIRMNGSREQQERFWDLVSRAQEAPLEAGALQIDGSALLERVARGMTSLKIFSENPAEVRLDLFNADGQSLGTKTFYGTWVAGSKAGTFTSTPGALPFKLSAHVDTTGTREPLSVELELDFGSWCDHDVSSLPYLDWLWDALPPLVKSSRLGLTMYVGGMKALWTEWSDNPLRGITEALNPLEIAHDLAAISKSFGMKLMFPREMSNNDAYLMKVMYALGTTESFSGPFTKSGVMITMPVRMARSLAEEFGGRRISPGVRYWNSAPLVLLGQEFKLGTLEYLLSNPVFTRGSDHVISTIESATGESVSIGLSGTEESELVVRRIPDRATSA